MTDSGGKKVLNVGGNDKRIPLPAHYAGWTHHLLDIDPRGKPDIVADARDLKRLPAASYDAVYCSHNLEHYHAHEVPQVLGGFLHVLKPDGFAEMHVPDIALVMRIAVERNLDIEDVLYQNRTGPPVTVKDVLYGFGEEIARSGNPYYAHKTGFTPKSLVQICHQCGFQQVFSRTHNLEVRALAFKCDPSDSQRRELGLPAP